MQMLHLASWEVADLKLLLAVIYAISCFALHSSRPPEISIFWSLWWLFNSKLSIVGLGVTMLVICTSQVAFLRQSKQLTVSSFLSWNSLISQQP